MDQETLRMQMLAGIITEAEYKEKLDEGWKDWIAGGVITLATLLGNQAQAQFFKDNKPDKISQEKGKELLAQFKDDLKNGSDTVISDTIRKVEASDSAYFEYDVKGDSDDERISKPALLKTLYTIQNKYYNPDGSFKGSETIDTGELASGEKVGSYLGLQKTSKGDKKASSFDDERFGDDSNIRTSFATQSPKGKYSQYKVTKNSQPIFSINKNNWDSYNQYEKKDYLNQNLYYFEPGEDRLDKNGSPQEYKRWTEEINNYIQDYNQKYPDDNVSDFKFTPELFSQAGINDETIKYVFGATNESRLSKIVSEILGKNKLK